MTARDRKPMLVRLVVLAVLVGVALWLFLRTVPRIQRYQATEELCAAAERQDWRAVLDAGTELIGNDPAGRRAAQCRCAALLAHDERQVCVDLLEGLLADSEADEEAEDWLPDPTLTALVVASRDEAGDPVRAADLARRGAAEHPYDALLLNQELTLRARVEDETSVLTEMERRLEGMDPDRPETWLLRFNLAARRVDRGDWDEAEELLGDDPDRVPEELRNNWFVHTTEVLAQRGEAEELAATVDLWKRHDDDELKIDARHALLRSYNQIEDRDATTLEMLRDTVARSEGRESESFVAALHVRLVSSLAARGLHDEALELLAEAKEKFPEVRFNTEREDILRSATQSLLGSERLETLRGAIRYSIDRPLPGDRLLVSPGAGEPVDAPYPSLAVPASGGPVEVERPIGTWPQRWVLRDRRGRTVGSGSTWPRPDVPVRVAIERREPGAEVAEVAAAGRPADGRRRVFQVILDCADWRLVEYGLARDELPFFEHAVAHGRRAVLDSDPPFTALAVSKLVFPGRRGLRSFPELLHQLGVEIEGLNAVGRNPMAGLEWVIAEREPLFQVFARAGLASVNLLHSHGALQVGRNAEVIGPGDRVRSLEGYRASRPLTADEEALLGEMSDLNRGHLTEMAADLDVLRDLTAEPDIDFVSLRVASLDLLTHGRFQEMLRSGQDDGEHLLYRVYRYLDLRLAEVLAALDGDDALIVMSDHGIRTPMEHDRRALFIALGEGIEPGRIDGAPPIQHVSGWIADLFGLGVDWPGAGSVFGSEPGGDDPESAVAVEGGDVE